MFYFSGMTRFGCLVILQSRSVRERGVSRKNRKGCKLFAIFFLSLHFCMKYLVDLSVFFPLLFQQSFVYYTNASMQYSGILCSHCKCGWRFYLNTKFFLVSTNDFTLHFSIISFIVADFTWALPYV